MITHIKGHRTVVLNTWVETSLGITNQISHVVSDIYIMIHDRSKIIVMK